MGKSPAAKRYLRRFFPTMVAYLVAVFGVSWAFRRLHPAGPLAWLLAILPALPILTVIALMGVYLKEEKDEFVRNMLVESMLWGIGFTTAFMTVWGFLEMYVDAPKLSSFWAFPLFCMAMGIAQQFVRRRYR